MAIKFLNTVAVDTTVLYVDPVLNQVGIKTHLVKRLNMREQLIKLVEIIPIEVIVRNIATGSLTKRLGITDGTKLEKP